VDLADGARVAQLRWDVADGQIDGNGPFAKRQIPADLTVAEDFDTVSCGATAEERPFQCAIFLGGPPAPLGVQQE
jgi:hypothetical protein